MSIQETTDNNVIDNILTEMNNQNNQVINHNQNNIDPNNGNGNGNGNGNINGNQKQSSFNLNKSDNRFIKFVNNFKSSIIVGILIIVFSFPQINKVGKCILKVDVLNTMKYSYIFPYLVNGIVGGILYYYLSNLNI
tara:strand:+ start:1183 stop:1590 length:408 start_codon:yes stop_codon:yes gene_type:complete